MQKASLSKILILVIIGFALSGCASASEPIPSSAVQEEIPPSEVPPTNTAEPTETPIPTPTPLPGAVVIPLDSLGNEFPWLPRDEASVPGTYYFVFNQSLPPFNNVLVRQAFAAAIDRETLIEIAKKHREVNQQPATTFTHPETLGLNLYNEVGIPFNPERAQDLLKQAGYTDMSQFPPVTVMINYTGDNPGRNVVISDEMIKMWNQYLDITVEQEIISDWGVYLDRTSSNPTEIFLLTWASDYNDPHGFLQEAFESNSGYSRGYFSNSEYDSLVNKAADSTDPAERQNLYIQAERILCETEAAIIPIYHGTYDLR